jgi:hypothetical protein
MRITNDGAAEAVGHCAALVLDPSTESYLCSIYDRRPQVCRDLERGSPGCAGERSTKGGRPKRALAMLAERSPELGENGVAPRSTG